MYKSGLEVLRFDRLVRVEKRKGTKNELNEETDEWETYIEGYAGVYPLSAREFIAAQAGQAEVTHRIITRVPGISPHMRVNDCGRIFDILGVVNRDERGQLYTLVCREVLQDG